MCARFQSDTQTLGQPQRWWLRCDAYSGLPCMPTMTVPFQFSFTSKFHKHLLMYLRFYEWTTNDAMRKTKKKNKLKRRRRRQQHIRWFYSQTHLLGYCFRESTIVSSVVRWQMPLYHVDGVECRRRRAFTRSPEYIHVMDENALMRRTTLSPACTHSTYR